MNNNISRRDKFIAHQLPDEYIKRGRMKAPFRPHSLCVLICDPRLMYFVACVPTRVSAQDPLASLVPLQLRLNRDGRNTDAPPLSIYDVSVMIANQVLEVTPRLGIEQIQYLGSTYGNHECGRSRSKEIHWTGLILPTKYRQNGFYSLLKTSESFSRVEWLSFREWNGLGNGSATSDVKYRMVLQALVALAQKNQKSSTAVRAAHQQLKNQHPDLLPQLPSFDMVN